MKCHQQIVFVALGLISSLISSGAGAAYGTELKGRIPEIISTPSPTVVNCTEKHIHQNEHPELIPPLIEEIEAKPYSDPELIPPVYEEIEEESLPKIDGPISFDDDRKQNSPSQTLGGTTITIRIQDGQVSIVPESGESGPNELTPRTLYVPNYNNRPNYQYWSYNNHPNRNTNFVYRQKQGQCYDTWNYRGRRNVNSEPTQGADSEIIETVPDYESYDDNNNERPKRTAYYYHQNNWGYGNGYRNNNYYYRRPVYTYSCRGDYECPGNQKCCSGVCQNPGRTIIQAHAG